MMQNIKIVILMREVKMRDRSKITPRFGAAGNAGWIELKSFEVTGSYHLQAKFPLKVLLRFLGKNSTQFF